MRTVTWWSVENKQTAIPERSPTFLNWREGIHITNRPRVIVPETLEPGHYDYIVGITDFVATEPPVLYHVPIEVKPHTECKP
jgi:hypothetical protein